MATIVAVVAGCSHFGSRPPPPAAAPPPTAGEAVPTPVPMVESLESPPMLGASPPPAAGAAPTSAEVDAVVPKYLRRGEREPSAPLLMYLLFDQASDSGVQFAALRAVVCVAPGQMASPSLETGQVPMFIPVKTGLTIRASDEPTIADVRRLQSAAYDYPRATAMLHHLGVKNHHVFLVASQRPIDSLAAGQAMHANQKVRVVDLNVSPDYVGAVVNSTIEEALDGSIFAGPSAKDRGYVVVSFFAGLGGILRTAISPINEAEASTSSRANADRGACR